MKNHDHCEHELEHCTHCDVVTCKKCKQEWGSEKPCTLNHYPTYIPYYPQPVYPTWTPYWSISPVPYGTVTVSNVWDTSSDTLT